MSERWFEGLLLGRRFSSDERLVMRLSDGVVVRTRSIQELPSPLAMEIVDAVQGEPWQPNGVVKATAEFERAELPVEQGPGEPVA